MSATITLTLPPDLERSISAKASASGEKLEDYLVQLIQKALQMKSWQRILMPLWQK
jgi:hypothetical protein